jgi:hypothetical protein
MISTLTVVILVSFGNQSLLTQAGMDAGALEEAQAMMETIQGNARQDFRLVNNASSSGGTYQKSLSVVDTAPNSYTTKRVNVNVSWYDQSHTKRSVSLRSLVTDFQDASTTDTCDSALAGDWTNPVVKNYTLSPGDLLPANAPAGHTFSLTNPIAQIDAYHGRLYVGVSKKASAGNDSFFVFDNTDTTQKPQYIGSINSNASVTEGMNALVAVGNYVYVANAHVSNFKTCKPSANCSQLQILNVSSPALIPTPVNFLIPTSSTPLVTGTSTSQALGNSVFYAYGYVYLGLTKTATGPEFNIIDVRDANSPRWIGGYHVGASINQIYVRNGYAYLTDDDKSRELIVLDVHNPASPILASTFDPIGTLGYEVGKSLYTRGDVLFAGMSFAFGSPELYILNVAHPYGITRSASSTVGSSVMGMFARDSLLFVLTSTAKQFTAFDISDLSSIKSYASPTTLPGSGVSLDCEGNYFFVASNNGVQGNISVIGPHI